MSGKTRWRLGCQTYTFRKFTLFETIDKNASLGLKCIEAYPGQMLSPEYPTTRFNHLLPKKLLDAVKAKLDETGTTLVNYGVVALPGEEERYHVFEFAKEMGIETIVAEPPLDTLDIVENLCAKYGVNLAIHNHPAPSLYWNPDTVVKACEGRSVCIGACADTGHWVRSGKNPLEALKKLEGRIISLHVKDVDRYAPDAADVPWGTGVGDVKTLLAEVHRQNIQPVFSIEYEAPDGEDPFLEVAQCAEYFRKVSEELACP